MTQHNSMASTLKVPKTWQPKLLKIAYKSAIFCIPRSFKVIDVGIPGKLVSSACLCLSATVFVFTLDELIAVKWRFLRRSTPV